MPGWLWLTVGVYVVGTALTVVEYLWSSTGWRVPEARLATVTLILCLPIFTWQGALRDYRDERRLRAERADEVRREVTCRDVAFWTDLGETGTPLEREVATQVLDALRGDDPSTVATAREPAHGSTYAARNLLCRCETCVRATRELSRATRSV